MRSRTASGLIVLSAALLGASYQTAPTNSQPERKVEEVEPGQDVPDSRSGCLTERRHWSYRPKFAPGVEVVLVRFLRFETPGGRTIAAKAFLYEIHPGRVRLVGNAAADDDGRRGSIPARMACTAFEIDVDEEFVPDFEVPVRYVKQRSKCQYEVNLGSTTCIVTTT